MSVNGQHAGLRCQICMEPSPKGQLL